MAGTVVDTSLVAKGVIHVRSNLTDCVFVLVGDQATNESFCVLDHDVQRVGTTYGEKTSIPDSVSFVTKTSLLLDGRDLIDPLIHFVQNGDKLFHDLGVQKDKENLLLNHSYSQSFSFQQRRHYIERRNRRGFYMTMEVETIGMERKWT